MQIWSLEGATSSVACLLSGCTMFVVPKIFFVVSLVENDLRHHVSHRSLLWICWQHHLAGEKYFHFQWASSPCALNVWLIAAFASLRDWWRFFILSSFSAHVKLVYLIWLLALIRSVWLHDLCLDREWCQKCWSEWLAERTWLRKAPCMFAKHITVYSSYSAFTI